MLTSVRVAALSASRRQCQNLSTSNLNNKIDRSKFPVIKESELEEKFIGGSGPGGQNVNKAVNCCQLRHVPTGLIVKVHISRKLEQNRQMAREILATKLDNLMNGEKSVENQRKRIALQRLSVTESLAEKKRQMKRNYVEQILHKENLTGPD